ncbi:hypothetical protein MMPV_000223 [Pyropia vietnamensis]
MEYLTTPDSVRRWNLAATTPGTGPATALVPGANRQAHIRDSFQSLFSPSLDLPPLASSGTIVPSPSLLGPRFTAPTPLLSAALTVGPGGGGSAALCPPSGTPGGNGSAIAAAAAAAAATATVPVAPGTDVPASPARPDAVLSSPFLRQAAKDAVVREFHNTYLGDGTVTGSHVRFGGMASPAWNVLLPSTPGVGRPPPVPTPGARPHGAGVALPQGTAGAPKRKTPAVEAEAVQTVAASPVKDETAARSVAGATKPPAAPLPAPSEPSKTASAGEASSTAPTVDVSQVPAGSSTSRIPTDAGGSTSEAETKLAVTAPISMAMPNLPAPYAAIMYGGPGLGMYMPSASMAAQMQFQHWQQMYQQSASVGMFPTVPNPLVPPRPGQFPATLAAAAVAAAPPVKETAEERKSREETEKETLTREFKKKTREAALLRFRQKRRDRKYGKLVRYTVRKALADGRPRVKGRFVKMPDDIAGGSSASAPMDSSDSGGGSPSMTSADAGSLGGTEPRRAQPLAPPPPPGRGKPPCTPVSSG